MSDTAVEREDFLHFYDVQPAVMARLDRYAALLVEWQRAKNLVSSSTLDGLWSRHISDCYQLLQYAPADAHWLDIGSGAGLPGAVVLLGRTSQEQELPAGSVTMIEANGRKCAFLRAVSRETARPAMIVNNRIESVPISDLIHVPDIITARALAPLPKLCDLMAPLMGLKTRALVHKGQDFASEIEKASKYWDFDVIQHQSQLDDSSVILAISNLQIRR
tara:strand:- start:249 stop:905 length:657 start_codon:yes stop_codon:yes gene_type:complete